MIDLKKIQKYPDSIKAMLLKRSSLINFDDFLALDAERREALGKIEALRAKRNSISQAISIKKRAGESVDALLVEANEIGKTIEEIDAEVTLLVKTVEDFLLSLPNMLHETVPFGTTEEENVVSRVVGTLPTFSFEPKAHWELFPGKNALDFERSARMTGSRFALLWGSLAKLERSIGQFCLDIQTEKHSHVEVSPPYLVNRNSLIGTGQLPKFEEDLFSVTPFGYYLIPTAEVPLTNIYAGEVIPEKALPLKYVALTPCFRSEAGSYGKDTKGLIRQHQFMKTEMVHFAHPEHSYEQLETMVSYAEVLLQMLELPYRVITLCSGDTGFSAAKTYDIEVWLPSQNTYREISSCSNCEDFQSRRANIRYSSSANSKNQFVHTLNGSGLPLGRTLVAILENYQNEDGTILIPKVLQKYMGMESISL